MTHIGAAGASLSGDSCLAPIAAAEAAAAAAGAASIVVRAAGGWGCSANQVCVC